MKLTTEQVAALKPILQRAVNAQIKRWECERAIESYLDTTFSGMGSGIEALAVDGKVKADDVRTYISCLTVEPRP